VEEKMVNRIHYTKRSPWKALEILLLPLSIGGCDSPPHEVTYGADALVGRRTGDDIADRDNDGIPDLDDECPDKKGHTNNGCPTIPEIPDGSYEAEIIDRDGDGIPDNEDLCPEKSHPGTQNGCGQDVGVIASPTDETEVSLDAGLSEAGVSENIEALIPSDTDYIDLSSAPFCPHLTTDGVDSGYIAWQDNSGYFLSLFTMPEILLGPSTLVAGNLSTDRATLCNISKSIAYAGEGKVGAIWPVVEEGNRAHLKFILRYENTGSLGEVQEVANFPIQNYGLNRRHYFASIDTFPDERFIVVWSDRDRVFGRVINKDGEPEGDAFTINRRALDVLEIINPDVSVIDDSRAIVTWQEGYGEDGNIYASWINLGVEGPEGDIAITEQEESGRWPRVINYNSDEDENTLIGYVSERGALSLFNGQEFDRKFFFESSRGVPEITADEMGRTALIWTAQVNDQVSSVQIADIGNVEDIADSTEFSGHYLADTEEGRIALVSIGNFV